MLLDVNDCLHSDSSELAWEKGGHVGSSAGKLYRQAGPSVKIMNSLSP